jgi:predicted RNase H-like HicB family nuclease
MNRLEKITEYNKAPHFTARIFKDGDWWVGVVEEVPGVNAQEKTKEELLVSLQEVLLEILDIKREDSKKDFIGIESEEVVIA